MQRCTRSQSRPRPSRRSTGKLWQRLLDSGTAMNATLNIAGGVLVLFGAIWFLQGINVLPGSFMTGQIRWAVYGGLASAAGITLLLAAGRRRRNRSRKIRPIP